MQPYGLEFTLSNMELVGGVKQLIEGKQGTPKQLQRLLFLGQEMMDDTRSLLAYGLGDRSELYMVRSLAATKPPRR